MNAQVLATGLIDGNIGKYITDQLDDANISLAFYPITSATRNSIAILHDDGKQTELLETGPEITAQEATSFLAQFEKIIKEADVLTLSRSLPKGVSSDFYQQLIQKSNGIPILLDTSGQSLTDCLSGIVKPFLIKPNLSEIQALTGRSLTVSDLRSVLSVKQFAGIEWIVVSLGSQGAIAKHHDMFYRVTIPKIETINPVGSGDATIAGLAYGIQQKLDDISTLKTGWINYANFKELFDQINVERY